MNYSLLAKVAIAGAVLTGVTGTAAMGNIVGVNQEAKAQQENPNHHHFNKEVDGRTLDLTNALNKSSLSGQTLADEIAKELEKNGLNPGDYKFKFEVKTKNGGKVSSNGYSPVSGEKLNDQLTFNPQIDTLEEFDIQHK
ncbi:hypothetical protein [Staphylococcus chromogenes]|uniref:hypothetical protein n=1 Tax=Staphylococcus chromogenes TaxID=46126 RepID=UPI0028837C28|nr:hypothetical protein [Staphylococcus chromogenes]MDT0747120.1 hypothetical protein [Staphylococcus chromogenes]